MIKILIGEASKLAQSVSLKIFDGEPEKIR